MLSTFLPASKGKPRNIVGLHLAKHKPSYRTSCHQKIKPELMDWVGLKLCTFQLPRPHEESVHCGPMRNGVIIRSHGALLKIQDDPRVRLIVCLE